MARTLSFSELYVISICQRHLIHILCNDVTLSRYVDSDAAAAAAAADANNCETSRQQQPAEVCDSWTLRTELS